MSVLAGSLVVLTTVFGAKLAHAVALDHPFSRREFLFPVSEWAAFLGALVGCAASISIWTTTM